MLVYLLTLWKNLVASARHELLAWPCRALREPSAQEMLELISIGARMVIGTPAMDEDVASKDTGRG
jgi:hypothetical protein